MLSTAISVGRYEMSRFLEDQQVHQVKRKILNNLNYNPDFSIQCRF